VLTNLPLTLSISIGFALPRAANSPLPETVKFILMESEGTITPSLSTTSTFINDRSSLLAFIIFLSAIRLILAGVLAVLNTFVHISFLLSIATAFYSPD